MHPYGMKKSLWPYELQGHPIQIHYSTANIRVPPINCGFPTSCGYQWIMDDQKGSKQLAFISCRQSQFSGPFGPIVSRVNSQLQCTWLGPFLTLRWSSKCWPVELLLNMLYSNVYIFIQITTWNATQTGWAIAWSLLADCSGFRGEVSKEFPLASNFCNPEIHWFSHRNKCQNLWMLISANMAKSFSLVYFVPICSKLEGFECRRVLTIFSQWDVYQPL